MVMFAALGGIFSNDCELVRTGEMCLQNYTYGDLNKMKSSSTDQYEWFIVDKDSNIWLKINNFEIMKFDENGFLVKKVSLYRGRDDEKIQDVNFNDDYITVDLSENKIIILDYDGNIIRYLHLPLSTEGVSISSSILYENTIFTNGMFKKEGEQDKVYMTAHIDYETGGIINYLNSVSFNDFAEDPYVRYYTHYPLKLPNGNYITYNRYSYEINEFRPAGDIVNIYREKPDNYQDHKDLEDWRSIPYSEIIQRINNKEKPDRGNYPFNSSIARKPILYNSRFIIPRRLFPPYYIDIYDFVSKEYVGQVNLGDKWIINSNNGSLYYLNKGSENEQVSFSIFHLMSKDNRKEYTERSSQIIKQGEKFFSKKLKICSCDKDYDFMENPNFAEDINEIRINSIEKKTGILSFFFKEKKYLKDYINRNGKYHIIYTWKDNREFINFHRAVTGILDSHQEVFDAYLIMNSDQIGILKSLKQTMKVEKGITVIFNSSPRHIDSIYYDIAKFDTSTIIITDDNGKILEFFSFRKDGKLFNVFERFLQKINGGPVQ